MEKLVVRCHEDIKKFCEERGISINEFNEPVEIPEEVKDCSFMFLGCMSFNQPVVIPDGVLDCHSMFAGCISFNHPVTIPKGGRRLQGYVRTV